MSSKTLIRIIPSNEDEYQLITLSLPLQKETKRVNFTLRYLEKIDRWVVSMADVQTNEVYFLNVPLVAMNVNWANNLLAPHAYKRIGELYCIPVSESVSTENPSRNNLNKFWIIWGDGVA
jgi:hypothetical protein